MLTDIKNAFLRSFFARNYIRPLWGLYTAHWWEKSNRQGSPPHAIKERIVRDCARRFDAHTMIETGTFHGDMVYAVRNVFARIYTIELSETFCVRARQRLAQYP